MQIVIDIDEKIYNEYMNLATGRIPTYKACDIAWILKNGTVLPKGHGRLIDISKYEKYFNTEITYDDGNHIHSVYTNTISTIIEADK